MSAMDHSGKREAMATSGMAHLPARGAPPIHLPTWSQLHISAKQTAPAGNSGDFFEVIQLRDGRVTVVLCDVSGNGPSAAAPVGNLRWVLRQAIARGEGPGAVLATLNECMVQQRIDDRFATAVCARVDAVAGRAEIASAGHLGPFVRRAAGSAEDLASAAGLALGIFPGQLYPETCVELGPEDALVLVTDGITDRLASDDDRLGERALCERLSGARLGGESICGALLGAKPRATEDATVLVVEMPRRHRRVTPVARAG
ncbi:MAG TPA: PP2C family protein-serine/threonine phosphatase [Polyangia bacterium]